MLPYILITKQQELIAKVIKPKEEVDEEDESSEEEIDDYHINGYHPVHIK